MAGGPALFLTPDWPVPASVRALCTVRGGGVSLPPYKSLNLGQRVGDDPVALADNLRRVQAAATLPSTPEWLQQVHGHAVVNLDRPGPREADAAYTLAAGRVCAIQTADCLPVLFAARDGSAVGAAHAGWKGALDGIVHSTVSAMQAKKGQ